MSQATYDEWVKEQIEASQSKDVSSTVKIAVQAEVAANKLTGSTEWDYFLSIIAGLSTTLEVAQDHLTKAIFRETVVRPEDMVLIKLNHAYIKGQLDMIETVMMIPKTLKENGEEAQAIVTEFKKDYDA